MKRAKKHSASLVGAWLAATALWSTLSPAALAAPEAYLPVNSGDNVTASMLHDWINGADGINVTSDRFVLFLQWFGGNMVNTFTQDPSGDDARTAAAAAQAPGGLAIYGGYDYGSTQALLPQDGRT